MRTKLLSSVARHLTSRACRLHRKKSTPSSPTSRRTPSNSSRSLACRSPAYGERQGPPLARRRPLRRGPPGLSRNIPYPHAWRHLRDYVIDAFNRDKPYDQFIREQIAGDLLPARTDRDRNEHLVATGLLALGVKDVNQRFKVRFTMDNIDEQIDVVGRGILGLTVSCARCHDHKFDPIPTTDYYALAGIFGSTDLCAALRSKMGGGGLDYYGPTMLVQLGFNAATARSNGAGPSCASMVRS